MRIIYQCIDCGKNLSYRGEANKGKRCHSCGAKWQVKHNPRYLKNGFKKGNAYGKRFYKDQPATSGSFKKGHKHSIEVLKKLTLACIGKRSSPATEFKPSEIKKEYRKAYHLQDQKYREWRKRVFCRDDFTCQICKKRGGFLHAHHIKPWIDYPEDRYSVENGITVHDKCHIKTYHSKRKRLKIAYAGRGYMFDALAKPSDSDAELLVCLGDPHIYKKDEIAKYPKGIINIHTSLLPKYRGRHPVDWAMENEEKEVGVTIHYMDEHIDTGDIILQDSVPYIVGEGYVSVTNKLAEKAKSMLEIALRQIENDCVYRRKQNEEVATYYPKRTKPRIY